MGKIYTVDFINKRVLEVRDVPTFVITTQMIRDLCWEFQDKGLAITASSIQMHYLIYSQVEIDLRDLQGHIDYLVAKGVLAKKHNGKTFVGYKYKGPSLRAR